MFTGAQQLCGLLEVHVVWCADVNYCHFRIGGNFVDVFVGAFEPQRLGRSITAFAGTYQVPAATRTGSRRSDSMWALPTKSSSDDRGNLFPWR